MHHKTSYLFGISEKISVTHFSNVSSVSNKRREKNRKPEMQFPKDLRQSLYLISPAVVLNGCKSVCFKIVEF